MKYELFCSSKNEPDKKPEMKVATIETEDDYLMSKICRLLENDDLFNRKWLAESVKHLKNFKLKEKCESSDEEFEFTKNQRIYEEVGTGKFFTYCAMCSDGGCMVEVIEEGR
jgi:predicted AlkP superfamily pyrophosphatase or phosphodiesterase